MSNCLSRFRSFFIGTFIAKSTSRHANVGASGSLNVLTVGRAAVHFNEFTDHGLTFVECASRLRSFPFHRNKNRTLTRCGSERLAAAVSRVVMLKYWNGYWLVFQTWLLAENWIGYSNILFACEYQNCLNYIRFFFSYFYQAINPTFGSNWNNMNQQYNLEIIYSLEKFCKQ